MPDPVELTTTIVRSFKFPKGSNQKAVDLFDTAVRGFHVRAHPSGKKDYRLKYHLPGKGQRYRIIGEALPGKLEQARRTAYDIKEAAKLGRDVVGEAKAKANRKTIGELVPVYLAQRLAEVRNGSLRLSTYAALERYLKETWKPLHKRFVGDVKRADVVELLDKIDDAPVAADRARSALSGFYDWCIDRNHCEASPVLRIKNRSTNGSRKRVLSAVELKAVWQAAGDDAYGRIVKLLILTGQRKSEIGGLQRCEIVETPAGPQIELPGERAKNGKAHVIPLAPLAWAQLPVPLPAAPEAFVFGRYDTTGGFSGWSKSKAELDRRITKGKALKHWTLHDLRRTFVTHMSENRFGDRDLVELVVNHVSGSRRGVAGVYDRSERLEERRSALQKWADWIERLVGETAPPQRAKAGAAE
jgi:integrase